MQQIMLFLFVFAIWSMRGNCDEEAIYRNIARMYEQRAVNCTSHIPLDLRRVMTLTESTNIRHSEVMLDEYLFACLRAKLRTTNWTSPFSHMHNSTIEYAIGLNEVLSFGFDGVLTLRARDPLRLLLLSIVQSTHSSTLVSCALMKAFFRFKWTDPRTQWRLETDIGNWTFPVFSALPGERLVGAELSSRKLHIRPVRHPEQ